MSEADHGPSLREYVETLLTQHQREHLSHEKAHEREHDFAQQAIDKAAEMAKENKADANEWRGTMTDRERTFATKVDLDTVHTAIDRLEDAEIRRTEREGLRITADQASKEETQRRVTRSQWTIGLIVGLTASVAAIAINLIIRLTSQ